MQTLLSVMSCSSNHSIRTNWSTKCIFCNSIDTGRRYLQCYNIASFTACHRQKLECRDTLKRATVPVIALAPRQSEFPRDYKKYRVLFCWGVCQNFLLNHKKTADKLQT
jgi:hypothetical protein